MTLFHATSLRTFFGDEAERLASGLSAFLPGDEFYEFDTERTYQSTGAAWVEKGGGVTSVTTKATDYTATANDKVIKFTSNATLTLPAATGSGQHYLVRASGCTVVIDGNGADTINEELTQTLFAGDSAQIIDEASGLWGVY